MNNPKKGPFDLSINLNMIPSYQSRFASMDRLTGAPIKTQMETVSTAPAVDACESLRAKLGSGQDLRSNPSVILRRNGVRV